MTQSDLAAFSGVSRAEIINLESGKTRPYVETLAKLAEALDCGIDEIIGERK